MAGNIFNRPQQTLDRGYFNLVPVASLARQILSAASGSDDNSSASTISLDAGMYKIGGYVGGSVGKEHLIGSGTTLTYKARAGGTAGFSKNSTGLYAGSHILLHHICENGGGNYASAMVDFHTANGIRADGRIGASRELDGKGLKPDRIRIEGVGQLYRGDVSAYVVGGVSKELSEEYRVSGHFAAAGGMVDGEEFVAAEAELRRSFDCPQVLFASLKECFAGAGAVFNSQGNDKGVNASGQAIDMRVPGKISPFVRLGAHF